jgi:hypothetical protein
MMDPRFDGVPSLSRRGPTSVLHIETPQANQTGPDQLTRAGCPYAISLLAGYAATISSAK